MQLQFSASPPPQPEVELERTLHEFRVALQDLRDILQAVDATLATHGGPRP
ncbi:hypothetical protein [Micromonospora chalcea]|uniref:hypothetical protein n=1 Tax=Micromonospora chalcea TaxID=1874 RepID=UPI0038F73435